MILYLWTNRDIPNKKYSCKVNSQKINYSIKVEWNDKIKKVSMQSISIMVVSKLCVSRIEMFKEINFWTS